MVIKIKTSADVPASEITPEHVYHSRRDFIRNAAAGVIGAAAGTSLFEGRAGGSVEAQAAFPNVVKSPLSVTDKPHTWEQITNYNNFYEFGTAKDDPARYAGKLKVRPWTVKVEGLVKKPADYAIDDMINMSARGSRLPAPVRRSVVDGDSLGRIPARGAAQEDRADVNRRLRRVHDADAAQRDAGPGRIHGQSPLSLRRGSAAGRGDAPVDADGVGLYAKLCRTRTARRFGSIPGSLRLQSGKSIVRIRLTDKQPRNTCSWRRPTSMAFYANVNPGR
jgi:sulfoxide reductase catalytic subunit YedY